MLGSCAREQNAIDLLLIRYVLAYMGRGSRDALHDGQENMSTRLRIEHGPSIKASNNSCWIVNNAKWLHTRVLCTYVEMAFIEANFARSLAECSSVEWRMSQLSPTWPPDE